MLKRWLTLVYIHIGAWLLYTCDGISYPYAKRVLERENPPTRVTPLQRMFDAVFLATAATIAVGGLVYCVLLAFGVTLH